MIEHCLQRDPQKRPTATTLLKDPFFKKANDIEFLRQKLVPLSPSLEIRAKKSVRVPGTSGRLKKGNDGTWIWEDDEVGLNEDKMEELFDFGSSGQEKNNVNEESAKASQMSPGKHMQFNCILYYFLHGAMGAKCYTYNYLTATLAYPYSYYHYFILLGNVHTLKCNICSFWN